MQVRSGETPRFPEVKPPCVIERPGVAAMSEKPSGQRSPALSRITKPAAYLTALLFGLQRALWGACCIPDPSIGAAPRYDGSMTDLLPEEYSVCSPKTLIQGRLHLDGTVVG